MARRQRKKAKLDTMHPTPEREGKNHFQSAGMARKLVPEIVTLRDRKKDGITVLQWLALDYYREQAHAAKEANPETSPIDAERIMGGTCCQPSIPQGMRSNPAVHETRRIEQALGDLLPLTRAIAVNDKSLSQWCIEQFGGREERGTIVPRVKRSVEQARERIVRAADIISALRASY